MDKRPKIPTEVSSQLEAETYRLCEEYNYGACDRTQSGKLLDLMNEMDSIGGILREYMSKEKVRTYIKDVLVHNYAVSKRSVLLDGSDDFAKKYFDSDNYRKSGTKQKPIYVLSNVVLIVANGTMLKWETALRHALESRYGFLTQNKQGDLKLVVVIRLSYPKGKYAESDFIALRKTLEMIDVGVDFVSE